MHDQACIDFLQWCLPRLGYRWRGFRKVRRQVCRRVQKRMQALELCNIEAYKHRLETYPEEWHFLDGCCDISVTHFYRDKQIFERIGQQLFPCLIEQAFMTGTNHLRCWSLGCCSGEEPYSLRLIWNIGVEPTLSFPCSLEIIATDRNPDFLQRACNARYGASSIKDLPPNYIAQGFSREGNQYRLKPAVVSDVVFSRQDIRHTQPEGPFDLICCRNLVFTYFSSELQQRVLKKIYGELRHGGFLIIGAHESLPNHNMPLRPYSDCQAIYKKS